MVWGARAPGWGWKIKTATGRTFDRNTVVVGRGIHSIVRWKTKRLMNTLFRVHFFLLFFLFLTSETKETFDQQKRSER